ncbi:MAG: hypothetical protein DRH57_01045 [Candidatus Cloacimonadota bacterium]|nr:MAG: hypothetical protein DRH57_01045 [Candidatus Cloacimonadota bacterium]
MNNKTIVIIFILLSAHLIAQQRFNLSNWDSNIKIKGKNPYDFLGKSCAIADVNGDGIMDIIISASSADPYERNSAGEVYIIYGKTNFSQNEEISLNQSNPDVTIIGAKNGHQLGYSIATGNFNNDLYEDIAISAPYANTDEYNGCGLVYIIFGNSNIPSEIDLQSGGYDCLINGCQDNEHIGISLATGDINGDSYCELIIGSPYSDYDTKANCGAVYIIFGSNSIPNIIELANDEQDIKFVGANINDELGMSVAIGKVNNDDYFDICIGSPGSDPNNRDKAGIVYLFKGRSIFIDTLIDLAENPDMFCKFYGANQDGEIGYSVDLADVNGDNLADILLGDKIDNNGFGSISIITGRNNFPLIYDLSITSPDVKIIGTRNDSYLGEYVSHCNFNQDNFADVVIGIPYANIKSGNGAGIIYILFGNSQISGQVSLDDRTNYDLIILGAGSNDNIGQTFATGDINNDGKNDILFGSVNGENNGIGYLIFGGLPYIQNRDPDIDETGVQVNHLVEFDLIDDDEGIDIFSVLVVIAGITYNCNDTLHFSYIGTSNNYSIKITPEQAYGYNQFIDVTVDCSDLHTPDAYNMPKEIYSFRTKEDTDPPYVTNLDPEANELDVPVNTNISFDISDLGDGVDINSVIVSIENDTFSIDDNSFLYSGTPEKYSITIVPDEYFAYEQVVYVSIDAQDLSPTPNVMLSFTYSFTCASDTVPPYVSSCNPAYGDTIGRNSPITVLLKDDETGVDTSSIAFKIDGIDLTYYTNLIPISMGYKISYLPCDSNFYYSYNQHSITVLASDLASIPNSVDTTSIFYCVQDKDPPYTDNHFPEMYWSDAATNTKFCIEIKDDLMGVDSNSIYIKINNDEIIVSANTLISSIENGFLITYYPDGRWTYNPPAPINVVINAQDLADPPNIMPEQSYYFICTLDTVECYITNLNPPANFTGVSISTNVYFEIKDHKTGVNPNSIQLIVDSVDCSEYLEINSVSDGYSVFYDSPEDFDFEQQVHLQVIAEDNAIIPNVMDISYSFFCQGDTIPPYILNQNPAPNEPSVPRDTDIYLEVADDGVGVDTTTIELFVNNQPVNFQLQALPNGYSYAITHNPDTLFSYNQVVEVSVTCQDLAANVMPLQIYSFRCVDDDYNPPFLQNQNPAPESENIPVNTTIYLEVLDADTGVDSSSIRLEVNYVDITFYTNTEITAISSINGTGYSLAYNPTNDFNYSDVVNIHIEAKDNSSNQNQLNISYYFSCVKDTNPPVLLEYCPGDYGYPNSVISLTFTDTLSGIDSSSFILKVNDEFISSYIDTLFDKIYQANYANSEYYAEDTTVSIFYSISDNCGNTLSDNLSFIVIQDTFPPYLANISLPVGSTYAKIGDTLWIDVLDKGMGIRKEDIEFYINSMDMKYQTQLFSNPFGFDPDSLGYRMKFILDDKSFYQGEQIICRIFACDVAVPSNKMDSTFVFLLEIPHDKKDKVVIIPPIITPNHDNKNDEAIIYVPTNKNVKAAIYNRFGEKVKDLFMSHKNDKYCFIWDGMDNSNKLQSSGLYIYQVKIGSKTYQGTVVLAR